MDGRKDTGTSPGFPRRRPFTPPKPLRRRRLRTIVVTWCNRGPRKAPQVYYRTPPKCPCDCWFHGGTPQMPPRCHSTRNRRVERVLRNPPDRPGATMGHGLAGSALHQGRKRSRKGVQGRSL